MKYKQNSEKEPTQAAPKVTVMMLLTNGYDPDPRVRQEALSLLSMGYRVRLLAWDRDRKSPRQQNMEGVEVERIHLGSRHGRGTTQILFYAALYLQIFFKSWRTHFDVIHCHDLDTLPIGFLLGKLKRKPIVYDSHENFLGMLTGSVHPAVSQGLARLEDVLIQRVDLLITVGEKLRQSFVARGARRTAVIGNWKRLSEYDRTEEQNLKLRQELGIPSAAIVITCITQLLKNRMIGELVEAVRPYPDVYVVLAGKGALEADVQKWAAEEPRIVYAGFLHASQVPAYTCASDAIYCGFDLTNPNAPFAAPNKLFEALAAGKPLITPDIGEIGDLVRKAQCGIVLPEMTVAALQAAVDTLRNPDLRKVWTRNAKDLGLAEMNWEKGHERLRQEYAKLGPVPILVDGRNQQQNDSHPALEGKVWLGNKTASSANHH